MNNNKPKIILGIDPGYGTIGYGLIQQQKNSLNCISYGCITTPPDTPFPERLHMIRKDIQTILNKKPPACMAIEKLFFQKNTKTALDVSQARGVIIVAAKEANIPVLEFTPLQVKQAVTGYGKADKLQIKKMVKLILNLDKNPNPDDAADALAIAICASHTLIPS